MGMIILENLLPLLVVVLTPVLLMLTRGLMQAAAKKWHLEGVLKYEEKVEALVLKGIKGAEKKAMNAIKNADDGEEETANEAKLKMAMDFVNATLKANGLPEKGGDELAMLIESKIFDGAKKAAPAELNG
jgi:hypothetical protein